MEAGSPGPPQVIHLDTSFLIRAIASRGSEAVRLDRWLAADLAVEMSAVAWAEFLCGPLDEKQLALAERIVPRRVPIGDAEARLAAELFNRSGRRRGLLLDCLIAASAIEAGASLATANVEDFARFTRSGLILAS